MIYNMNQPASQHLELGVFITAHIILMLLTFNDKLGFQKKEKCVQCVQISFECSKLKAYSHTLSFVLLLLLFMYPHAPSTIYTLHIQSTYLSNLIQSTQSTKRIFCQVFIADSPIAYDLYNITTYTFIFQGCTEFIQKYFEFRRYTYLFMQRMRNVQNLFSLLIAHLHFFGLCISISKTYTYILKYCFLLQCICLLVSSVQCLLSSVQCVA